MKAYLVFTFCFMVSNALAYNKNVIPKPLLIIDFNAKDKYTLFSLSQELEKNGYQVTVESFYRDLNLNKFSSVFLNLSLDAIKNSENPLVQNILNQVKNWLTTNEFLPKPLVWFDRAHHERPFALSLSKGVNKFSKRSNKSLGLIFPDLCFIESEETKKFVNYIFESADQRILDFLNFNSLSSCQNTSLLPKRDIKTFYTNPLANFLNRDIIFLPKTSLITRFDLLPIALYWNFKGSHIFISKSSRLLVQEINEDFRSNPVNKTYRKKLKEFNKESVKEFSQLSGNKKRSRIQKIEIPKKTQNSVIYCGWGDLDSYHENLKKKVDYILDSKLGIVWLQAELELYFGPNATKSSEKKLFLEKLKSFTGLLVQRSYEKKCKLPKFLIGLNITSNFKNKEVKNCVTDFYGEKLDKIPSCLDFSLWRSEVIDVLDEFFKEWSKISDFAISGVFLDLEMYHAQKQASSYTNLLDFSDCTFKKYCDYKKLKINFSKHEEKIDYLIKNNLIDDYLSFIKKEAFKIGCEIKEFIFSKINNPTIGVYIMQLPHEAFYLGLCSGLSSVQDPIILATFNLEFLKHQNWLYAQNIFCKHLTVIMLSKFLSGKDVNLIKDLSKDHDGVWFNRFSRLGSPYNSNSWWASESTKMNHNLLVKKLGSCIEKNLDKIN